MSKSVLDGIESTTQRNDRSSSTVVPQPYPGYDLPEPAPVRSRSRDPIHQRWGILLAGGDGVRLRTLTRIISGDDRPKQFCNVVGKGTLFEQTQKRAARSICPSQTIVALTEKHEEFYRDNPYSSNSVNLVQPMNRGTAPAIILSLLHLSAHSPDAIVAVLPCDHFYSDEDAFHHALETAFRTAGSQRQSIVLLGAQARGPEVEFGWVKPGARVAEGVSRVRGFEEKPDLGTALDLFSSGCLWNTFVMVGTANAFLRMSLLSLPSLFLALSNAFPLRQVRGQHSVPGALYEGIDTADFSKEVLTKNTDSLLVLRLQGLEWNDLGCPDRVVSVLCANGEGFPAWMANLSLGGLTVQTAAARR